MANTHVLVFVLMITFALCIIDLMTINRTSGFFFGFLLFLPVILAIFWLVLIFR